MVNTMKQCNKLLAFMLTLCLLLGVLSGCNDKSDFVLSFELDERPTTLDPQLASTLSETILTRNLYEGLMRVDQSGNVVPAAASEYSVTNDGLTYQFKISDKARWSNGSSVTANDFLYAFKRAVDPLTEAPLVELLYNIKNAQNIVLGQGNASTLGVKATDDKTLSITLNQKDDSFLYKLTTPICMPCNKTFFDKSAGKYGLTPDTVLTNGSFEMRRWLNEKDFSMRIIDGKKYDGKFKAAATAVIFTLGDAPTRSKRIEENYINMGFVDYSNADKGKSDKAAYTAFQNTCYSLVINNTGVLANNDIRSALERSLHRNLYQNELPSYLKPAATITPPLLEAYGANLNSACNFKKPADYDPTSAHTLYKTGVKNLTGPDLSGATILYLDDANLQTLASLIAGSWQLALGAYVNIEKASTLSELHTRMANGNYQIALVPISANSSDAKSYLSKFTGSPSANVYGFKNTNFDQLVSSLNGTLSKEQYLDKVTKAVNLIYDSHTIIPICYSATVFAVSSSVITPAITADNGYIDLAYVKIK